MEGFNDVWANILNGDIINNSENISEHPSLLIDNQKFEERKADLSTTNQMIGDISAINPENAFDKSPERLKLGDISKEEGQLLEEINAVLQPKEGHEEESKHGDRSLQRRPEIDASMPKRATQSEHDEDAELEREIEMNAGTSDSNPEQDREKEVRLMPNKDKEKTVPADSKQKTEDKALIEDQAEEESLENQSRENL